MLKYCQHNKGTYLEGNYRENFTLLTYNVLTVYRKYNVLTRYTRIHTLLDKILCVHSEHNQSQVKLRDL